MSSEAEPRPQPENIMNRVQLASRDKGLQEAASAHFRAVGLYMENPVSHYLDQLNVAIGVLQLAQLELQFKYELGSDEDVLALDLCEERLLLAEL